MFLDDEEATAHIRKRRAGSSLWVAVTAVTACILMMAALVGTASAQEVSRVAQVITPQLLVDGSATADSRLLYGGLMVVFSIAAAGLWCRSFLSVGSNRAGSTGGRISQS